LWDGVGDVGGGFGGDSFVHDCGVVVLVLLVVLVLVKTLS